MNYFYETKVLLKGDEKDYKRIFQYDKILKMEDVKSAVLKDVFMKIEYWDLESFSRFNFNEISEDTFYEIKNNQECVSIVLEETNWVISSNTSLREYHSTT